MKEQMDTVWTPLNHLNYRRPPKGVSLYTKYLHC